MYPISTMPISIAYSLALMAVFALLGLCIWGLDLTSARRKFERQRERYRRLPDA